MPNMDSGHYFLTVLAPVKPGSRIGSDGQTRSWRHLLREELSFLPTMQQGGVAPQAGEPNSPFSRNRRTHFTRFNIIDDVLYNGRDPQDAVLTAVKGTNLLQPQDVDRLSTPFLMWAVDFDIPVDEDAELDRYLVELWDQMGPELSRIFSNCVGFDGVADGPQFARYVRACQIETTMPFNDYWITPPPLAGLSLKGLLMPAVWAGAASLLGLLLWLFASAGAWGPVLTIGGAVLAAVLLRRAYDKIMATGAKPFPPAPNSDLRSVLKALYLQQQFIDFAIAKQGADAESLYQAFGDFLRLHKPDDLDGPSQPPGVIETTGPAPAGQTVPEGAASV